jgi:hypothetical protein
VIAVGRRTRGPGVLETIASYRPAAGVFRFPPSSRGNLAPSASLRYGHVREPRRTTRSTSPSGLSRGIHCPESVQPSDSIDADHPCVAFQLQRLRLTPVSLRAIRPAPPGSRDSSGMDIRRSSQLRVWDRSVAMKLPAHPGAHVAPVRRLIGKSPSEVAVIKAPKRSSDRSISPREPSLADETSRK